MKSKSMKRTVTVASTALLGLVALTGIAWYSGLVDRVLVHRFIRAPERENLARQLDTPSGYAGRREPVPAVRDELDVAERLTETSTAAGLPQAECVPEAVGSRRDLRAQLERVQSVVVARDAHRRDAKLSKRTCDTLPTYLRVAGKVTDEQKEIVCGTIEERDVFVVPEQMNITDHADRGRLRGKVVHGTKLSRPRASREQERKTA